jgi:hypothetical protein
VLSPPSNCLPRTLDSSKYLHLVGSSGHKLVHTGTIQPSCAVSCLSLLASRWQYQRTILFADCFSYTSRPASSASKESLWKMLLHSSLSNPQTILNKNGYSTDHFAWVAARVEVHPQTMLPLWIRSSAASVSKYSKQPAFHFLGGPG